MDKEELRERREALGLTQTRLANELGVSLRTVQAWESGLSPIRQMVRLSIERLEQQQPKR